MSSVKTVCPNCGDIAPIFFYRTPADARRYWNWMAFEVCYNRFQCSNCGSKRGVHLPLCDVVIDEPPLQLPLHLGGLIDG